MKDRLQILLVSVFVFICSSVLVAQEFGIASVYQDKFHGKTTAYGRTYNRNEFVAAHKKHLPGTFIKVTRLDTKQSVTVEVIDRGPFVKGRIVDLSSRAAKELGMLDEGVANIKLEVVQKGKPEIIPSLKENDKKPKRVVPENFDQNPDRARIKTEPITSKPEVKKEEPVPTEPSKIEKKEDLTAKGGEDEAKGKSPEVLVGKSFTFYSLYKLRVTKIDKPDKANFGVQVAYLSNFEGLLRQVAELQSKKENDILFTVDKESKDPMGYKVILGLFETDAAAKAFQKELRRKGLKGFVVAAGKNYEKNALLKVQLIKPLKANFGVQVASLANEEGVMKQIVNYGAKWFDTLINIEKGEDGATIYKVILGAFETEAKAKTYKSSLSRKHRIKGFVVALN